MNMPDKAQENDAVAPVGQSAPGAAPGVPRRGHRGTDARDAVAEMAARAQEISQEAGSKVSIAMKEIILGAAGLAGFAVESARDLVQYMVRRGQMTPEEGDKLLREAEEGYVKSGRPLHKPAPPAPRPSFAVTPASSAPAIAPRSATPVSSAPVPSSPARPAVKAAVPAAPPPRSPERPAAKGAAGKSPAVKSAAGKAPTKPAAKSSAKTGGAAGKSAKKASAKPPAKKGASASRAKPAKKGSAARKR
jgi:polyhydroxyalkanoate synthesis regulator phasin